MRQVNNKLHVIHPQLGLRPGVTRREQSVLSKMRIGRSHSTHSFLLKGDDPPRCKACDCRLTIRHILFDCFDFIEIRSRHFDVNNLKELFEKILQTAFYHIYMRLVCLQLIL